MNFSQMCGLTVYSFIEDTDLKFYKLQKALGKKMDIADWIPGIYNDALVEGGVSPLEMARRINPDEFALAVTVQHPEPLVGLHPGTLTLAASGNAGEEEEAMEDVVEEEEEEEEGALPAEGEVEEGGTGFTQESEAPLRKKAMRTPQSKLVPALTIEDAREMFSRDATATFRERRRLKGKKLYGDYAEEETIAISSEDDDDVELGKRLREEPATPGVIASNIPVKPETMTVDEANERSRREEEQRLRLERAAAEVPSVRDEVAELRAMLLEQNRQRAMPPPPSPMDLVAEVIKGMMAQGFAIPTPAAFPHQPAPYHPPSGPASSSTPTSLQLMPPPSGPGSSSFAFQGMTHPHHPYAPVQQVDDLHLWRQGTPGHSRPLTPPPLRPALLMPPPHQQDDPRMFGSADPNPTAAPSSVDDAMVEAEGQQRPGDTSTPNPVDDPMHDAREETGLVQRPESQSLNEQVAAEEKEEDGGVHAQEAAQSTASRPEEGEVML